MAQVINRPGFVAELTKAFEKALPGAAVEIERVNGLNRSHHFRFLIVSTRFAKMDHATRQELVWNVVAELLPPEQRLRISMILALSPGKVEGE